MTLNQALLKESTVNADVASVVITVPSGYTDLRLVASARSTRSNYGDNFGIRFNSDTGSNYSYRRLYGLGSGTPGSTAQTSVTTIVGGTLTGNSATANTFGNADMYIPDYAGSNYKQITNDGTSENNATDSEIDLIGGSWNSTAAITSITLYALSGNIMAGSSFTLYGIAKLGVTPTQTPKATGGDIITNDGTYWYHAFLSSGSFIPQKTLSCDYLVVAGGGGSSSYQAQSGGGAGGLRYATNQSLSATNYAVTVGAGGAGGVGTAAYITGSTGSASSINSLEAAGGGGGSAASYTAGSGGSGGGSWSAGTAGTGNTPSTSPVQGYNGAVGSTDSSTYTNGGAGGGAGGAASAAISTTRAANGGVGFYSSLTDAMGAATGTGVLSSSHYYYAGGGGGFAQAGSQGTGGIGGGGSGGGTNAGAVNTGGGAGGNGGAINGNAGGSGIVIVRYAMV